MTATPFRPAEPGLYVARSAQTVLMRVAGLGTMHLAPLLQLFVDAQVGAGRSRFALDLSACTGLDSTFMGTMAGLARSLPERGGQFLVLNVSDDLRRLLATLGVWPLLTVRGPVAVDNVDAVRLAPEVDAATRLRRIHDAHRMLVTLDARNRERFGRFLAAVDAEMAAAAPAPPPPRFAFPADGAGFAPDDDAAADDLLLDDFAFPLDDDNDTPPAGLPTP